MAVRIGPGSFETIFFPSAISPRVLQLMDNIIILRFPTAALCHEFMCIFYTRGSGFQSRYLSFKQFNQRYFSNI